MSFSKEADVRLDRDGIDAPQPADQGGSNVHAFRKERPALAPSPPIHGVLPTLIFTAGEWLAGHSKFWNLVLGAAMVAAIGLLDLITGPDLSLSIFYLLPIALITWSAGRT